MHKDYSSAFRSTETYLFSLKNNKNYESKGLTDFEKIVNHGFDEKISFRNM